MIIIAAMLSPSISAGLGIQRGDDQGMPSQKGTLLEAGLEGAESSKTKRKYLGRSPRVGLQLTESGESQGGMMQVQRYGLQAYYLVIIWSTCRTKPTGARG